jgi:hypothetical protein
VCESGPGLDDSGYSPGTSSCELDNDTFDSIQGGKFLYQLRDHQVLKENGASWS